MNAAAKMYAALTPLAPAGGIWPMARPDDLKVWPGIVYSTVSSIPQNTIEGNAPTLSIARVQVDAYDVTYPGVKTLATSIKAALVTYRATFANWLIAEQELYESEVKLYRVSLDFGMGE